MFINRIGWPYYRLQGNYFWRIYYFVFGVPFMSSHIVYGLVMRHNVIKKGERVLDIGCGNGVFLNQLSIDKKITGLGIDRMTKRILFAKEINNQYYLNNVFIKMDFEKHIFNMNKDVALLIDVIEHLSHPDRLIKRLSKSSISKIIIQTPHGEDKKYIVRTERFLYGKDQHLKSGFKEAEIKNILESSGYQVTTVERNFYVISQIIYEILELIRRKSRFVYAILWPFFYPICWVDTIFFKFGKSNGLLVVATKK